MKVNEQAFHDRADRALAALAEDDRAFRELFAHTTRLVGDAPITTLSGNWPRDAIARAFLLREAAQRIDVVPLTEDLFRQGDPRAQQAIARALSLLPTPERFVSVARLASSSSVTTVFEALSCNNPYPARHLPDDAFVELVQRVLFVGLPLVRVIGLRARVTPDLRRIAHAFANERRAAGAAVPRDLDLIFVEDVA